MFTVYIVISLMGVLYKPMKPKLIIILNKMKILFLKIFYFKIKYF